MLKRIDLSNSLLLASVFLTFFGQKIALLFMSFLGLLSLSSYVTIGIRILVGSILLSMFFIQTKKRVLNKESILFLWFCASMGISIFFDITNNNYDSYYLSEIEVVGYFVLFCLIPFFVILNSCFSLNVFNSLIKQFLLSGFIFSSLAIITYRNFIGEVGRLSKSVGDGNILSPLILSYGSALIIVIGVAYLSFNKVSSRFKIFIIFTITISTIPFFLGSSRGGLLAIFISLLSVILFGSGSSRKIKLITVFGIMISFAFYIMNTIQSNLLLRVEKIQDIQDDDARLLRYFESYQIIRENPLLGNGLVLESFDNYPHNIILEVLQATGLVGLLPFTILILKGFKATRNIFLKKPKYAWIAIIFIQTFVSNMLSGSVITASWFWFSLALVIVFDKRLNIA